MALSLADTLAAQRTRPGTKCRFAPWINERPDAGSIVEAFQRGDVPSKALHEWLASEGLTITRNTVDHHRRGLCSNCADAGIDVRRRP